MRRLIANLDAEVAWSRLLGASPPALGMRAREAIAGWGSLLRVFADPSIGESSDRLWLPAPLDPSRLTPCLPRPALETGRVDEMPGTMVDEVIDEVPGTASLRTTSLRWAAAPLDEMPGTSMPGTSVPDELRPDELRPDEMPGTSTPTSTSEPTEEPFRVDTLTERLWHLASTTDPSAWTTAARVNHRRFALDTARALGLAPPGAGAVRTPDHLRQLVERHPHVDRWVVKAALSTAGRARHLATRDEILRDPASKLPTVSPSLGAVAEPWDRRLDDFGLLLWIDDFIESLGVHRLLVDQPGRFLGIEIPADDEPLLEREETAAMRRMAQGVGQALSAIGYRGPVGIDMRRIEEAGSGTAFRPLGEINARLTIGFLARAVHDRLQVDRSRRWRLQPRRPSSAAPKDQTIHELLTPDARDRGGLWLVGL